MWTGLVLAGALLGGAGPKGVGPAEKLREIVNEQAQEALKGVLEDEPGEDAQKADDAAKSKADALAGSPKPPSEDDGTSADDAQGGAETEGEGAAVASKRPPKTIEIASTPEGVIYRITID